MSIGILLQQMMMIFILIMIGAFLYRKSMLSDSTAKQVSALIINICNPALLICSVFDAGPKASTSDLLNGFFIILISYAILILCGYLMPYILRAPKEDHFAYGLLTIYGNVGFIGIPLSMAVLGPGSLIYVSISNLIYNILVYTQGIATIKATVKRNKPLVPSDDIPNNETKKEEAKSYAHRFFQITGKFINAGTISAILTIILYLSDIHIPALFSDTLTHVGRSTTFLSMLVLGVSVAQMPFAAIFSHKKLYAFAVLRMVLIPVLCVFLFRLFTDNTLIISTTALMLSVPAGNVPLILCRQHDLDSALISRGIILSTLLSFVTIPIVTLFV